VPFPVKLTPTNATSAGGAPLTVVCLPLCTCSEYYQEGKSEIELFGIAPYGVPNTFWVSGHQGEACPCCKWAKAGWLSARLRAMGP
jgi:hypothetical protein